MFSTYDVVPAGPYFGYTLRAGTNNGCNLEDALTQLLQDRKNLNASLLGSSVNGQAFQFASIEQQRVELDRRQQDLQAAFAYLDPGRFPAPAPSNRAVIAF
jgi:hypothetical protein